MNIDLQRLMYAAIKVHEACRWLNQFKETIDEDFRNEELRKGSIDVEFRVIK
jgi:truncated hemoglobin YjbI